MAPQLHCLLFSMDPSVLVQSALLMLTYPMGQPMQKEEPGGLTGTEWEPEQKCVLGHAHVCVNSIYFHKKKKES